MHQQWSIRCHIMEKINKEILYYILYVYIFYIQWIFSWNDKSRWNKRIELKHLLTITLNQFLKLKYFLYFAIFFQFLKIVSFIYKFVFQSIQTSLQSEHWISNHRRYYVIFVISSLKHPWVFYSAPDHICWVISQVIVVAVSLHRVCASQ